MITLYLLHQFQKHINPKLGWYGVAVDQNNSSDHYLIFLNAFVNPAGDILPLYNCWHMFKNGVLLSLESLKDYTISFEYIFYQNHQGEFHLCL